MVAEEDSQGAAEHVTAKEAFQDVVDTCHTVGDTCHIVGDTSHVPYLPLANPWVDHDHAHPSVPLPSYFPVLGVAGQVGDTFD